MILYYGGHYSKRFMQRSSLFAGAIKTGVFVLQMATYMHLICIWDKMIQCDDSIKKLQWYLEDLLL